MNILEYIMAVYKTYYCSNLGLFIYHDDRLSSGEWSFCVFTLTCTSLFALFHPTDTKCCIPSVSHIWLSHSLHIKVPSSSMSQFWCIASKVRLKKTKQNIWELWTEQNAFFFPVIKCSKMSFRITQSCFLFRCYD